MTTMKRRILFIFAAVMVLTATLPAQEPTMVFDGTKLSITVPTGRLELTREGTTNEAIRNSFNWAGGESCVFMASNQPYVFRPVGLSTDEPVTVQGTFNDKPISIQVEMKPVAKPVQPQEPSKMEKSNGMLLYIIIGVVLLVLVALLVLLKRKKKKDPGMKYDPNVISIIKDESISYEHGLKHVKAHLDEYLTFDMNTVFADTAVNKVYLGTELIRKLYEFFSNSLEVGGRTNETGCFIIGCWDLVEGKKPRYDISLEYMIEPGDDADFGEYSLHFGKKISINMASVIDNLAQKTKRDYLLTCWMHSHPGLGLFLSNHDLIVQKQLTYSEHKNRLLAIVIDTNTPELKVGFFTAKADGTMNNKEEVKQWFSFEEIYHDAREKNRSNPAPQHVDEPKVDEFAVNPDYFNIPLRGDTLDHLGFAPHCINQIDSTLYSGGKGVAGYFFGEESKRYLTVDRCLPYENEEKTGCLIYDDDFERKRTSSYVQDLLSCRFCVNVTSDDKLFVWVKNENGSLEKVGEATMSQMKEWIRRKRV